MRILDDYGVDGFYNDLGYLSLAAIASRRRRTRCSAFEESPKHDGALGDLLALIYAEVKRRGGIVKVHIGGASRPQTDLKVYDYLWVGEGGRSGDKLREAVKNHPPYVVPCLDMSRAQIDSEDELYLHAIPYMQFPLLLAGRPFTGERAAIPGIKYPPEEKCFWTRHLRAIWKHYQAHPERPAQLRLVGFRARPARGPADPRALAQAVPAAGRGRHLGVAGDRRLRPVRPAAAAGRGRLGVRQPGVLSGAGQLRPERGGGDDQGRLRAGWRRRCGPSQEMERGRPLAANPAAACPSDSRFHAKAASDHSWSGFVSGENSRSTGKSTPHCLPLAFRSVEDWNGCS